MSLTLIISILLLYNGNKLRLGVCNKFLSFCELNSEKTWVNSVVEIWDAAFKSGQAKLSIFKQIY